MTASIGRDGSDRGERVVADRIGRVGAGLGAASPRGGQPQLRHILELPERCEGQEVSERYDESPMRGSLSKESYDDSPMRGSLSKETKTSARDNECPDLAIFCSESLMMSIATSQSNQIVPTDIESPHAASYMSEEKLMVPQRPWLCPEKLPSASVLLYEVAFLAAWTVIGCLVSFFYGCIVLSLLQSPPEELLPYGMDSWRDCLHDGSGRTALASQASVPTYRRVALLFKYPVAALGFCLLFRLMGSGSWSATEKAGMCGVCVASTAAVIAYVFEWISVSGQLALQDVLIFSALLLWTSASAIASDSQKPSEERTFPTRGLGIGFVCGLLAIGNFPEVVRLSAQSFPSRGSVFLAPALYFIIDILELVVKQFTLRYKLISQWLRSRVIMDYQIVVLVSYRLWLLQHADSSERFATVFAGAAFELSASCLAFAWQFGQYRRRARKSGLQAADRFMNAFLAAFLTRRVAEYIALWGSLAVVIFADPVVFSFGFDAASKGVRYFWLAQLGVELLVDVFLLGLVLTMMPVRVSSFWTGELRSALFLASSLTSAALAGVSALAFHIDGSSFVCGGS